MRIVLRSIADLSLFSLGSYNLCPSLYSTVTLLSDDVQLQLNMHLGRLVVFVSALKMVGVKRLRSEVSQVPVKPPLSFRRTEEP